MAPGESVREIARLNPAPAASYLTFALTFLVNGVVEVVTAIAERKSTSGWGWVLTGGIIDLVVGFVLVSNPALSIAVLPFVVGFGVLFRSVMAIGASIELKRHGVANWGLMLALGILGLLFAFILLTNPVFAGLTIVVWTAMAFFAVGAFRIWFAFSLRSLGKALKGGQ